MPTKRQIRFNQKVAQAARDYRFPKSRGKPMPKNLSIEGRNKGLEAMRCVPRCQSTRKDGQPCKSPAMRGATKCIKHGGRVQVPGHRHNIRRFLSGEMHQAELKQEAYLAGRDLWDAMKYKERNEYLELIPEEVHADDRKFFASVKLLHGADGKSYPIWRKALESVRNGNLI